MIEFSLKRFLSFFDCFMPAALSRFGTLAEFGSTLLARWPIVELASSINLPLTMTLTKVHSLLLELEIKTNKSYKGRSKLGCHENLRFSNGHAMFIGNSQKEARYFDSIRW